MMLISASIMAPSRLRGGQTLPENARAQRLQSTAIGGFIAVTQQRKPADRRTAQERRLLERDRFRWKHHSSVAALDFLLARAILKENRCPLFLIAL